MKISHSDKLELTPAEQMRIIRERVNAIGSPEAAQTLLSGYLSQLDTLRTRMVDLESKMLLREYPFTSQAPLIGRVIVLFRTAWNWMSTKWYVLPLMQQQNQYNMALMQTLRDLITSVEVLTKSVSDLQIRVGELEEPSTQAKAPANGANNADLH